jgi:hypothetical protein
VNHQRVTTENCGCTPELGCPVCTGGLYVCRVCGGAEGSLPSHCPGHRAGVDRLDLVYRGLLDYLHGRWVTGAVSPHCPAGQAKRQEQLACLLDDPSPQQ